jgi:D-amino-acid dehydrogenase
MKFGADIIGDETDMADHVVLCAGPGTPDIAAKFDVLVSLSTITGHALNFIRPDAGLPNIPIMHYPSRSALTVFHDHVRLSGTADETDPMVLLDIWRRIAPDLVRGLGAPISQWTGERPVSASGYPEMRPTERPGVWLNTGHGHMGWTMCAGAGERLAEMILPS